MLLPFIAFSWSPRIQTGEFGSGRKVREAKQFESSMSGWFGRVVCDEDHAAKTIRPRLYQAVARLEAKHVWFLTATPLYMWGARPELTRGMQPRGPLEDAVSLNTMFQALGRIHRLGQEQPQKVWSLFQEHSISRWLECNNVVKALPQLAAQLHDLLKPMVVAARSRIADATADEDDTVEAADLDMCGYLAILYSGLRRADLTDEGLDDAEMRFFSRLRPIPRPIKGTLEKHQVRRNIQSICHSETRVHHVEVAPLFPRKGFLCGSSPVSKLTSHDSSCLRVTLRWLQASRLDILRSVNYVASTYR